MTAEKNSSEDRIRRNMHSTLSRKFLEVMNEVRRILLSLKITVFPCSFKRFSPNSKKNTKIGLHASTKLVCFSQISCGLVTSKALPKNDEFFFCV